MRRLLDIFLSEDGDDARIVCARRCMDGRNSEIESLPAAKPYLESDRVAFIDIGRLEMPLSSSTLRTQRQNNDQSWSTATTAEVSQYIVDHNLYVPFYLTSVEYKR
jgi:nicotinic acid mononucleotide adenylyltransferase